MFEVPQVQSGVQNSLLQFSLNVIFLQRPAGPGLAISKLDVPSWAYGNFRPPAPFKPRSLLDFFLNEELSDIGLLFEASKTPPTHLPKLVRPRRKFSTEPVLSNEKTLHRSAANRRKHSSRGNAFILSLGASIYRARRRAAAASAPLR
jgi:hypothetical protein